MKKKTLYLLLFFFLLFSFTACSSKESEDEFVSDEPAQKMTKLEIAKMELKESGAETNSKGEYIVYWAKDSKLYHIDPDCPGFSKSETLYTGTVDEAFKAGITEPCRRCIREIEESEE